jgi:adenosylmethionine-8-amino-7-oxononanoate aminotransferase
MSSDRDALFPFVPTGQGAPLTIERAEGAYLYTREGQRILDAAGGAIVVSIGHGRREVAEAAARALAESGYIVPVFATEGRLQLVERLIDRWLPGELRRVFFTSGGSESVDAAMRLARQHHVAAGRSSRWKIIGRDLSYHGTTLATLAVGGHQKRRKGFDPLLLDLPKAPACYCLRCPLGKCYPDCRLACAEEIERIIEREGAETVAAFIAEPVVGSTAGAVVPPREYWPRVAEICRKHGVLLIADEVMTGFGRTGKRFAVEHWGLAPDILVSGKGLAGGYAAIGAVFATEGVVAPLAQRGEELMYYTFGGHPAACAVADKVLEIMEREDLVERAAKLGEKLHEALTPLEKHPNVAELRGLGLLQAIELVADRDTLDPFPAEANLSRRVVVHGILQGVFYYPGGADPARDIVCLGPPFIIGDEEIEKITSVLPDAIDAAVASCLTPG